MKFLRAGFWQKAAIALLLLLQVAFLIGIVVMIAIYWTEAGPEAVIYLVLVLFIASIVTEIYIINSKSPDVYKITWMFFVGVLPGLGIVLYVLFANKATNRSQRRKYARWARTIQKDPTDPRILQEVHDSVADAVGQVKYLEFASGNGIYEHTNVDYFPLGDEAYPVMLRELQKAKHYIFFEYFIIDPGIFWDSVLAILKQKAKEGVDVRVMYDDVGSLGTVPVHYFKELQKYGIKAHAFAPFKPFVDIRMNNRDHRKILVIDGHTCFTGGINIADEYINKIVRFGHWKDNAIMLKGDAVYGFTMLFLSNWNANWDEKAEIDNAAYRPSVYANEDPTPISNDGWVQPYGDLPFDKEAVGETMYMSILDKARHFVYLSTPYLIIDAEMKDSLLSAAKRGVDVRILVPHIPDKKAVFHITRSFYGDLMKAGIKIYEYTPGFVHEKMFVADDVVATVGTINMDYRSLYLHLECGTFMVRCHAIKTMKQDFLDTFEISHQVSLGEWEQWHRRHQTYWAILRILAPLL